MGSSNHEAQSDGARYSLTRERVQDLLWKAVAALFVAFLIYVLLHFGSQLIELQGG
ncbi:MAG: hypothetical protein JW880_00165 [Candidatus Thermoplasmatota archaeon]|nr:hypothetical protein [Candidatus Thermoplasmatota archaeon]